MPVNTKSWASNPTVFEINTWVWLSGLSEKYGDFVELGSVPSAEWDALAGFGFDAVWLMGVWERSPMGIGIANHNQALLEELRRALPDFHPLDNVGSPYCVRKYVVDELLGGRAGLAMARAELGRRGIRLLLDFEPNHVAHDHPWVSRHPEYFISGDAAGLEADPSTWRPVAGRILACGRDPHRPVWQDVLQLNAFHPGLRQAMRNTLLEISGQCDGLHCGTAMLVLHSVFQQSWGARAGQPPQTEYWSELISAVKSASPDFVFMTENHWDREHELRAQGFDFCFDRTLYDRLAQTNLAGVVRHLGDAAESQTKLVRFIENHDESRAAAVFSPEQQRAFAVLAATLPGARLFHEGQFEGRRIKLPVCLGRRPTEAIDLDLQDFYRKLTQAIRRPAFHEGEWRLCEPSESPAGRSHQNLLAWSWVRDNDRYLVIVNLGPSALQARIQVPWSGLEGEAWRLSDTLSGVTYDRQGDELGLAGLYVELGPWDYHLFECQHIAEKMGVLAA